MLFPCMSTTFSCHVSQPLAICHCASASAIARSHALCARSRDVQERRGPGRTLAGHVPGQARHWLRHWWKSVRNSWANSWAGTKQNAHGKNERITRQWSISNQHTSTITCTAVPRVWHFSAFHCHGNYLQSGHFPSVSLACYSSTGMLSWAQLQFHVFSPGGTTSIHFVH